MTAAVTHGRDREASGEEGISDADDRPDILLVEDEPAMASVYTEVLGRGGWTVEVAGSIDEARRALRRNPRLAVVDLNLPDGDGLDLLREATGRDRPPLVIVVTARGSIRTVVEAMRLGAYDFLVKPIAVERLLTTARNAFDRARLATIVDTLRDSTRTEFEGMIGSSPAIRSVYRMVQMVAPSRAPVLLQGESGTGKELCAEAIHRLGRRPDGPFVAVNCGAIPKGLAESELFGHVRGAFTDATTNRDGAIARANGGTLFLDEVGELPLDLQVKLLRFTQSMVFRRVGADQTLTADLRLVCATNRNLADEVEAGRFREDLYYRIGVLAIEIPPLRDRGQDIVSIARYYLRRFAEEEGKVFDGFTVEAEQELLRQRWPGNIRQLQNVVRCVTVLNQGGVVTPDALEPCLAQAGIRGVGAAAGPALPVPVTIEPVHDAETIRPLADIEREAIERAVAACNGNIQAAAGLLGISVATIYRRRQRWGIGPEAGDVDA